MAGGIAASNIARWNGTTWSGLIGPNGNGVNTSVQTLAVWDPDGPGPTPSALYVGGSFAQAGGIPASRVARWSGTEWSAVTGLSGSVTDGTVFVLQSFDEDGPGPSLAKLFAGGAFSVIGGVPAGRFAKWDGTDWATVDGGPGSGMNNSVYAMAEFDSDGPGVQPPSLVVGGEFTSLTSGAPASRITRWTGSGWSAMEPGLNANVTSLGVLNNGIAGVQTPVVCGRRFYPIG